LPSDFIDEMRTTAHWDATVATAPRFVYDCNISDATTPAVLVDHFNPSPSTDNTNGDTA
jgi:hypothetical protein